MKKGIMVLLLLLALTGCAKVQEEGQSSYKKITMDEAADLMEKEKNYIIVDVRTREEYEVQHIPGAVNIPNETIGKETVPELEDKTQMILVYCRSGNRSKQASEKLVQLGYENVIEFGGIIDWKGETVSENVY